MFPSGDKIYGPAPSPCWLVPPGLSVKQVKAEIEAWHSELFA